MGSWALLVAMVHSHPRRLVHGVPEGLNGLCNGRLVTGLSRHHTRASQQRQRHDDRGQHECSPCNLLLWARVLRRLDDAACGEADQSYILYHTENQSGGSRCRHGVKLGVYTTFVQIVSRTYYLYNPYWDSPVLRCVSYPETLCDDACMGQHTHHLPMEEGPIHQLAPAVYKQHTCRSTPSNSRGHCGT